MVIVLHWPTILVSLQQDMHVAKRFLFDRFDFAIFLEQYCSMSVEYCSRTMCDFDPTFKSLTLLASNFTTTSTSDAAQSSVHIVDYGRLFQPDSLWYYFNLLIIEVSVPRDSLILKQRE